MRNVPPYRCVSCSSTQAWGTSCYACGSDIRDQNGLPQFAPAPVTFELDLVPSLVGAVLGGATISAFVAVVITMLGLVLAAQSAYVGGALFVGIVGYVAWRHTTEIPRRLQKRERTARALLASENVNRFRGVVRVLEHAKLEGDLDAAAVLMRKVSGSAVKTMVRDPETGAEREGLATRRYVEEHAAVGRFAVVDEDGAVAVVDEDAFELCQLGDTWSSDEQKQVLALNEGDTVTIVGPAEKAPPPEDVEGLLKDRGYRGAREVLAFDGRPDDRVWIIMGSDENGSAEPAP